MSVPSWLDFATLPWASPLRVFQALGTAQGLRKASMSNAQGTPSEPQCQAWQARKALSVARLRLERKKSSRRFLRGAAGPD